MKNAVITTLFILAFIAFAVVPVYAAEPQKANWVCGDVDGNGRIDISDAVYVIANVFSGGPASPFPAGADWNLDGLVNTADAKLILAYIFDGGKGPNCTPYLACVDIDRNGVVNNPDVDLLAYKIKLGTTESQQDFNMSGKVDDKDAMLASKYINDHGSTPICQKAYYAVADVDGNNALNLADPKYIVDYIFSGGPAPVLGRGDVNGSGNIDISDAVYIIAYLTAGGPCPVTPLPPPPPPPPPPCNPLKQLCPASEPISNTTNSL